MKLEHVAHLLAIVSKRLCCPFFHLLGSWKTTEFAETWWVMLPLGWLLVLCIYHRVCILKHFINFYYFRNIWNVTPCCMTLFILWAHFRCNPGFTAKVTLFLHLDVLNLYLFWPLPACKPLIWSSFSSQRLSDASVLKCLNASSLLFLPRPSFANICCYVSQQCNLVPLLTPWPS